jgi:hypothetical protein
MERRGRGIPGRSFAGIQCLRPGVGPLAVLSENDDEKNCSKHRATLKAVGRGSVRTGRRASPPRLRSTQSTSRTRTTTRRICSKHKASLRMVGRGSVRTGYPSHPRTDREPPQTNRRKRQSTEDAGGRPITEYRTINEPLVPFTHSGSFVWVHAFSRVVRETPVRTEPLPTALSVALCSEQSSSSSSSFSFSICFGVNRSERVTRALH